MQSHGGGWECRPPRVERSRGRWDRAPAFGRVAVGVGRLAEPEAQGRSEISGERRRLGGAAHVSLETFIRRGVYLRSVYLTGKPTR